MEPDFVRDYINDNIKQNGERAITGTKLNTALNYMLDQSEGSDCYDEQHAIYGLQWQFSSDGTPSYTRIGDAIWHRTLPVQRRMRGCVLDANGKVAYYLDPDDWGKKEDGTASVLNGTDGNVMVEIPTFYYKYSYNGASDSLTGVSKLLISLTKFDNECVCFRKQYVGAYKGSLSEWDSANSKFVASTKMQSVKGTYATVNIALPAFRTAARNNNKSIDNWNVCTYDVHKAIWILFVTEYGNLNSQADFSHVSSSDYTAVLDSNGYHTGGLGYGIASGTKGGFYAFCPTGTSDEFGNNSGGSKTYTMYLPTANNSYTASTTTTTDTPCRYRGIENPFGEVWEWTDGIFFTSGNVGYEILDKKNFPLLQASNYGGNIANDCRLIGTPATASGVASQKILGGTHADIIPSIASGTCVNGKYYSDNWWNTPGSFTGLLVGGSSSHGVNSGLPCVTAATAPSSAYAHIGSRLVYIPDTPTYDELVENVESMNETIDDILEKMSYTSDERAVYGLQWQFDTSGNPTYNRLGDAIWHQRLPVQSGMRGCVIKPSGEINYYLDANNWAYKQDGTASCLDGTDGNVMVEIPRFYYKYTYEEGSDNLTGKNSLIISLSKFSDDCVEFKKQYVGAYKGSRGRNINGTVSTTSILGSVAGVYATVSTKLADFRTYARNNNTYIDNWNVITYEIRRAIWILFVTEYANLNSQADFNSSLNANGFKQGGLGAGLSSATSTPASGSGTLYATMPTGLTDAYGNHSIGSTNFTYNVPTADNSYTANTDRTLTKPPCRYRGIENPFGEVWEWTDGIFFTTGNIGYEILDKADFSKLGDSSYSGIISTTCRLIGTPETTSGGVLFKKMLGSKYCDIIPSVANGTTSNGIYYSDGWWNTPGSFTGLRVGGHSDYGVCGGLACVSAGTAPSNAYAYIGSRLVYIP